MKDYIISVIIGFSLGVLAKVVDFIPGNTLLGQLGLREIMNNYGIFICTICYLEYNAKNIKLGFLHTATAMFSMIFSYYLIFFVLFKIWAYKYLLLWSIITLCSLILYLVITLRRKKGYIALVGILAPIILLGNEALRFINIDKFANFQVWINLIAIVVLFWKFPNSNRHRIFSIIIFVLFIPFLRSFDLIRQTVNIFYGILF